MDAVTPWYVPVARAVPAIALAAVVTFSADHSASLGLLTFGIFAVVSGAILVASGLRLGAVGIGAVGIGAAGIVRSVTIAQGTVAALAGVVALALTRGGLPFFVFLLTTFAAITGFLELYLGLRARGSRSARDWMFVGGLTALLAVVVLLVPPELAQTFTGPDGVQGRLTASVVVVGVLGAYWAVIGIYLVIAGLSLKWSTDSLAAAESGVAKSGA